LKYGYGAVNANIARETIKTQKHIFMYRSEDNEKKKEIKGS